MMNHPEMVTSYIYREEDKSIQQNSVQQVRESTNTQRTIQAITQIL